MTFSDLSYRLLSGLSIPALQERCIITTVKQRNHSGRNQRTGLNGNNSISKFQFPVLNSNSSLESIPNKCKSAKYI